MSPLSKTHALTLASILLSSSPACDDPSEPLFGAGGPVGGESDAGGHGGDGDSHVPPGTNPGGEFGDGDGDGDNRGDAGEPEILEPFEGEGEPWKAPAPRASCDSGDQTDGDLQGVSGNLRCNLDILGQVEAPHFLSLAWYKDCAYVNGTDGTTVVHVDASGKPKVTTTLTQPGFRSNWETMKASEDSGLLVGYESNGTNLSVFDVAADCKQPALKSTFAVGGIGHAGNLSPDGTIYYASSLYTSTVFAVDLADPTKPAVITTDFDGVGAHDLGIGKNGNRGYFTYPRLAATAGMGAVAIVDLSEVQARKPGAKGKLISETSWPDGNTSQYAIPISIRGKDHLLLSDEMGSGNCLDPERPIWGYARIFDISDEQEFKLVSLIKTEAQDPEHCSKPGQSTAPLFGVGTHYCNVDRLEDPRLVACGMWEGGVRVFDIRNPWRPKEVAYFDTDNSSVPGLVRILPEKREMWVATIPNTFYVFKFREGSPVDLVLQTR